MSRTDAVAHDPSALRGTSPASPGRNDADSAEKNENAMVSSLGCAAPVAQS